MVIEDLKKNLYDSRKKRDDLIESKYCDLVISGSKFGNRVFRTAFNYSGEIYMYGSPRNDQLINIDLEKVNTIKKKLKISPNVRVLLYAPTFRDSKILHRQKIEGMDLDEVLYCLEKKTGERWICLIRAHSAAKGFENVQFDGERIIDVTSYEDMSDLLLITDLLISDYSSSVGDFALLKRPILLFQNDREEFIEENRTFYFDIDQSPYMVARNQRELIDLINQIDENMASKNCEEILDFYGANETGKSSERIVEYSF